ncbi:MFS transporter [Kitasatospora sp. NPDC052896]|uniref:MFS transporter n=1 Tax=Kitasatospora sp. NPDC052896 TaxID=3364061 RepID=UPI0037C89102
MAPADVASPARRKPPRGLLSSYRELLAVPGVRRMLVASVASKLPPTMISLSLLLYTGPHYSYAVAGLAVAAMAIGQGLSAPVRGRLIDRRAYRPIVLGTLAGYLVALAALVAVARSHGPVPLLLVLASLGGITVPPVGIMMRTLWREVGGQRQLVTAMALDSAMSDIAQISGPALAAWLCLSVSSIVAFALCGVLTVVAIVLVLSLPTVSPPPRRTGGGHWAGPLRSAALRRLLLVHAGFSAMITAVDVVISVLNAERHTAMYTGIDIGALSVGSIVGSLALGAVPGLLARGPKLTVLLGTFAAGVAVLAAASQLPPFALLLACPIAGISYGSTFGALFTTGGDLAPEGAAAETQAWLSSLTQGGSAAGAAAAAWFAASSGSPTVLCAISLLAVLTAGFTWNVRTRVA